MLKDSSKEAFRLKSAQGGYINAEYKIGCYKKGYEAVKSDLAAFNGI